MQPIDTYILKSAKIVVQINKFQQRVDPVRYSAFRSICELNRKNEPKHIASKVSSTKSGIQYTQFINPLLVNPKNACATPIVSRLFSRASRDFFDEAREYNGWFLGWVRNRVYSNTYYIFSHCCSYYTYMICGTTSRGLSVGLQDVIFQLEETIVRSRNA